MSESHDRNCASRWNASSECDCGADRVNAEQAIQTLESVNRSLEAERDFALDNLKAEIANHQEDNERHRWGLQWMLNNLTGIDHEWAKEACNIARQSLNPQPKG